MSGVFKHFWRWTATAARIGVALALGWQMAACTPQTPEDQINAYNKKLGPQAEFTGTHLIVRWPEHVPGRNNPVTLKIPREYLNAEPPVIKNEQGDIWRVYITMSRPDATPWQPVPRARETDPPDKAASAVAHWLKRVFVVLDRVPAGGVEWRQGVRESHQRRHYSLDGQVAGLERYSKLYCLDGLRGTLGTAEFVQSKEPDDSSPQGCRLDRTNLTLVSPPEVARDSEGAVIDCNDSSCTATFLAGRRGAQVTLKREDLAHWREIIEPIRARIDGFVVDDPSSTQPSLLPAPRS